MKGAKRFACLFLSLLMMLTLFSTPAYAVEEETEQHVHEEETENTQKTGEISQAAPAKIPEVSASEAAPVETQSETKETVKTNAALPETAGGGRRKHLK